VHERKAAARKAAMHEAPSIYLENPRRFDDGRFLLASRKSLSPIPVDVHARKSFAVVVENGNLPVLMLPSLISMQSG